MLITALFLFLGIVPQPAGATDPATTLPIAGFADLAVDAAHQRIFISGGYGTSSVLIADYNGSIVGSIDGLGGPASMVLDDTTLWVAAVDAGEILAVDVETLAVTHHDLGALVKPYYLAQAGGKLWFNHGGCGQISAGWGSFDPATGAIATYDDGLDYCPAIWASPGDPGTIIAADAGISPPTLYRYDVRSGTPEYREYERLSGGSMRDLAMSPDASMFWRASGAPYEIDEYEVIGMQPDGYVYPTGPYPVAVDVTADGAYLVAGLDATYDPDIYVFRVGSNSPLQVFDFGSGGPAPDLYARGVALSPDGSKIFAVAGDVYRRVAVLHVFDGPAPQRPLSTLSLAASPTTLSPGGVVALSGRLVRDDGTGVGAKNVQLYRGAPGESLKAWSSLVTSPDGTFSISDVASTSGTWTYQARWSGDPTLLGTSSPKAYVDVAGIPTSITLEALPDRLVVGETVSLAGRLTASDGSGIEGKSVEVSRQSPEGQTEFVHQVITDSDGSFSTTDTPPTAGTWAYTSAWSGDVQYLGATSTQASVEVIRRASSITLQANPASVILGNSISLSGILSLEGSDPPDLRTIRVLRESSDGNLAAVSTVLTGPTGDFSLSDSPPQADMYRYKAIWDGDALYQSSESDFVSVLVSEASPTAIAYVGPSRGTLGSEVRLSASLTDDQGRPLSGRQVSFELGEAAWSAITNSDGRAEVTARLDQNPGVYQVVVSYSGELEHQASSASQDFSIDWQYTFRNEGGAGTIYLNPSTQQLEFIAPYDSTGIKYDRRMQSVPLVAGYSLVVVAFDDGEITIQGTFELDTGAFAAVVATPAGEYVLRRRPQQF